MVTQVVAASLFCFLQQPKQPYRMRSPKGGLMEWLEGIPAGKVRELVLAALAESGVPHEVV